MRNRVAVALFMVMIMSCALFEDAGGGQSAAMMTSAWKVESDVAGAYMGMTVASGDFNGDSYTDVVVSAPYLNFLGGNDGRVFVYFGSAGGLSAVPGWSAQTDQSGAQFGRGVAAGDFNGDTYDDIAIGAPAYDDGQADEGVVFVWYGSGSGLGADGTPANSDWRAEADMASALFGTGVACAGDVNHDGYEDLIAGGEGWSNGKSTQGVAMAWLGSASGLGDNGTPGNADWMNEGGQAGAWLGGVMAGAGDVNGDTYDDIIVTARGWSVPQTWAGQVRVFYGTGSGIASSPAWTGTGYTAYEFFGQGVAGAGDLNNDGYDDIAITDIQYALVWYGSATGLGANGTLFNAPWNYLQSGAYRIAAAGDVDNDGYDDLIFTTTVLARLCRGSASGPAYSASWTVKSPAAGSTFGSAVSGAGDVNGDGYDDVVIGAMTFSNPEDNEGAAWVYLGNTDIVAATVQSYDARCIDGGVEVDWTLSDVVGDVSFEVYRRVDDGAYRPLDAVGVEVTNNRYVLRDLDTQPGHAYAYRVLISDDGVVTTQFEVSIATPGVTTRLLQSVPNPFNPSTTVRFDIASPARVTLAVYDVSGRLVRVLEDRAMRPGTHQVLWDGTDRDGQRAASGVYLVRLQSGKTIDSRTVVLLK